MRWTRSKIPSCNEVGTELLPWTRASKAFELLCFLGFHNLQQDHNVAWPVGSKLFFGCLDGLLRSKQVLGLVGFLLLKSGKGGNQSGGRGNNGHVAVVGGGLLQSRRVTNGGGSSRNRSGPAGSHSEGGRRDHLDSILFVGVDKRVLYL